MTLRLGPAGASLALLAFALAAGGQYCFTALDARPRGRVLYLLAMAVMLLATRLARRDAVSAFEPAFAEKPWAPWATSALAAAVVLAGVASLGLYGGGSHGWLLAAWIIGLLLFLVSAGEPLRGRVSAESPRSGLFAAGMGLCLLAGLALSLPSLETVPPDVHIDEATMALESRKVLRGETPAFLTLGWDQYPSLGFAIHSATMAIAGDSLAGFRVASVVGGPLTIAMTMLFGRLLFGPLLGLVAGILITVSHWHIHLSRLGLHYMDGMVVSLAAIYLATRGVLRGSQRAFAAAGVALGLCFYVYYTARLAAAIALGILLLGAIHRRGPAAWWGRRLGWMALGGLLTLAPLLVVYARSPEAALARSDRVSIFSPRNFEFVEQNQRIQGVPAVLRFQAQRTLEMFNIAWDASGQYGSREPLLDPITGVFFVMGSMVALAAVRQFRAAVLLGWVGVTLAGVMLTNGVPFSPRAVIALPAVVLLASLGIGTLTDSLRALPDRVSPPWRWAAIGALLMAAAALNVRGYFDRYVNDWHPAGVATTIGRLLTSGEAPGEVTLVGGPELERTIDVVRFLAPGVAYATRFQEPYPITARSGPASYLVDPRTPNRDSVLAAIQSSLPGAEVINLRDRQGALVLTVVRSRE